MLLLPLLCNDPVMSRGRRVREQYILRGGEKSGEMFLLSLFIHCSRPFHAETTVGAALQEGEGSWSCTFA